MLIAVDGNEANVESKVGVSVYTYNLLSYFKKKSGKNLRFEIFLKHPPITDMPTETDNFKYQVVTGPFLWSQIFLPLYLAKRTDIDVFFAPAHYAPRFTKIPTVVTVHDLSFFYFPSDFLPKDLFTLKSWTEYSVKNAKKVITVSNATKRDLLKFYPTLGDKVEVIYNGYEKTAKAKHLKLGPEEKDNPYILYVGTLQPRKNIVMLINAYFQLKDDFPKLDLVIAGKKGWMYEQIFQQVVELGISDSVYFTDFIPDNQLSYLYQNAEMLILPSLYEGFGIPVLESMSFGCPVIASNSGSLPEIGGDAALYFDPKNQPELVTLIKKLISDKNLRSDLVKKGNARVKQFSWEKCAEETLDILQNYANSSA